MSSSATNSTCILGVLDHQKYDQAFLPLIKQAKKKSDMAAAEELKVMIMGISDEEAREETLVQHERLTTAMASRQWRRAAAGHLLEALCVPVPELLEDLTEDFKSTSNFVYDWNEDHAETIFVFISSLSDYTLTWCSYAEIWRAVVPPERLNDAAEAFEALTPRELRRIMIEAEDGEVYSEDEAREISAWWETFRKIFRSALRTEQGLYVGIITPDE